jgi:hypothetical protein
MERDQWTMALVIVLLVACLYVLMSNQPQAQPFQPDIPTPPLRILPTLMPTLPPQVIIIERQAQPAQQVIEDNSVNVCIGFCPGGSR